MKLTTRPAILRLSIALLAVMLGSGCRSMQVRQMESRCGQLEGQLCVLESRIDQLENRASNIEGRMEPRVVPVPGSPQPGGN